MGKADIGAREHGDAEARLGITGGGIAPNYRIITTLSETIAHLLD